VARLIAKAPEDEKRYFSRNLRHLQATLRQDRNGADGTLRVPGRPPCGRADTGLAPGFRASDPFSRPAAQCKRRWQGKMHDGHDPHGPTQPRSGT
jgi:hypothetical protein